MKKLLLVLVLLGLSLAGLFYWINRPSQVAATEGIFTYGAAVKGDIVESVSATGSVVPKDIVWITSETAGTVVEVFADVNDVVLENTILVRLDDRHAKLNLQQAMNGEQIAHAAVSQAKAMQTAAEKALKYQQDLEKGGFRKDLEKAELELEAAKASVRAAEAKLAEAKTQVKQAELGLQMTEIKVPDVPMRMDSKNSAKRDYLILERKVKVGQLVGPLGNVPLFALAGNLRQMEVHTEIVEGDVGRLRSGQLAVFTINSYDDPDLKFTGTLREIQPVPTNVKGAVYYNAVIDVTNQKNENSDEWRLLPGMTTSVDIVIRKQKNVWKVPVASMNFEMEDAYQSPEARERIKKWKQRPDWKDWRPLWIWQTEKQRVWPYFVRLNDSKKKITGIQDGEYLQVLEWEAGSEPQSGGEKLRVIIGAPPASEPGILERSANMKLS